MKKIIGWTFYIPASFIGYFIALFLTEHIVRLVTRGLLWLIGFDFYETPVLFEYEDKLQDVKMDFLFYLEYTINIVITFGLSGGIAGFIAYFICPSTNKYATAIPPSLLLLLNNGYSIFAKWDCCGDMLYRSIVLASSYLLSVITCYISAYYCTKEK